jgi:hypothetical protein
MGSKSGYVDIEVGASTSSGAKEQLQRVYCAEQIINLREIRGDDSNISMPSGSTTWIVGLIGGAALFLYFTPWVLMLAYGATGAWVSEKITGQTIQEYTETDGSETTDKQHKKAAIVLASTLLLGMTGFIQGTGWNTQLNKEYNLDGKQPVVEQVKQK